jgi:hypothetical protein
MRKTIKSLEASIVCLQAYQEAYHCFSLGSKQVTLRSGEFSLTVTGLERAAGGVVIRMNDMVCGPAYAHDVWCDLHTSEHAHCREVADLLRKLMAKA